MKHPKIGIALGSGGAKGLAHIGVLKALEAHGIRIDYVAGASIGALIGAFYTAHPQVDKLEELIENFSRRKGFMLFDPTLRGGLIKGNKIENFISEILEGATFETLKIPFTAVATDFNSAEKVVLSKGDLVKAVRASISVPAIFQPIWHEERLLADGGLSDPIPDEVVRDMGSDIIIAVNLDHIYSPDQAIKTPSLTMVATHSINILRHNLALNSLSAADIIISPKIPQVGLVGWDYFFDTEKARQIIQAGEDAAKEVIPQIELLIEERKMRKGFMKKALHFFRGIIKHE